MLFHEISRENKYSMIYRDIFSPSHHVLTPQERTTGLSEEKWSDLTELMSG